MSRLSQSNKHEAARPKKEAAPVQTNNDDSFVPDGGKVVQPFRTLTDANKKQKAEALQSVIAGMERRIKGYTEEWVEYNEEGEEVHKQKWNAPDYTKPWHLSREKYELASNEARLKDDCLDAAWKTVSPMIAALKLAAAQKAAQQEKAEIRRKEADAAKKLAEALEEVRNQRLPADDDWVAEKEEVPLPAPVVVALAPVQAEKVAENWDDEEEEVALPAPAPVQVAEAHVAEEMATPVQVAEELISEAPVVEESLPEPTPMPTQEIAVAAPSSEPTIKGRISWNPEVVDNSDKDTYRVIRKERKRLQKEAHKKAEGALAAARIAECVVEEPSAIPASAVQVAKAPVVEETVKAAPPVQEAIIASVPVTEVVVLAPLVEEKASVPMVPQAAKYVPPHMRTSSARVEKVVILAPRVEAKASVPKPPQAAKYAPPHKKESSKAEPLPPAPAPAKPKGLWPLLPGQAPKPVPVQAAPCWGPASKGQEKVEPVPEQPTHNQEALQLLQQQKNADSYVRWEDAVYTDEFDILGPVSLHPTTAAAAPAPSSTPPATAQSTPVPTSEREPMPSLRDEDHNDDSAPGWGKVVPLRPYEKFVPRAYR